MAPTIVSSTTTTVVDETSTSNINTEEPSTSNINTEEPSTSNINTEEPRTSSTITPETTSDDNDEVPEKPQESKDTGFQLSWFGVSVLLLLLHSVIYLGLYSFCTQSRMKTFFVVTALFLAVDAYITWIEPRHPLPGERSPPGSPWPMPQVWERFPLQFHLEPSTFGIKASLVGCEVIDNAIKRYRPYIFSETTSRRSADTSNTTELEALDINVFGSCEKYPGQLSKETYNIVVDENSKRGRISADTIWGALRGLETFSQLVYQNENGQFVLNKTKIIDFPRFSYRGFLLDTARHFVPVSVIKKHLDTMSWNKFNAFHWHLVDDQSFPFESKVYPNLTKLGAYSPKHIYTQSTIQDVIDYARLRGIRVIPEIDSPGHTHAFGKSFPHLITPCYGDGETPFTPNYTDFSAAEILNPMIEETFTVMKTLIQELKSVFKDDYVHLGMDEVYYGCWRSNPNIKKFMDDKGFQNVSQVEQYYVERVIKDVVDIGYKYMAWQDPIENGVTFSPDTLVHIWKDTELDKNMGTWQDYIKLVTSKNYEVVLSACWYLNYISYGMDWKKYYECEPQDFTGTETQKKLVVGGQAAMWGEYVDGTNLLSRIWPRASAVAERLWSASTVNDTGSAAFRLDEQRCRMVRRGIPAQPILNGYCGEYDWDLDQN